MIDSADHKFKELYYFLCLHVSTDWRHPELQHIETPFLILSPKVKLLRKEISDNSHRM